MEKYWPGARMEYGSNDRRVYITMVTETKSTAAIDTGGFQAAQERFE